MKKILVVAALLALSACETKEAQNEVAPAVDCGTNNAPSTRQDAADEAQ